jgi:hypothetical protein
MADGLLAVVVRLRLGNWRGIRAASARHFSRNRSPLNAFEITLEILKSCQQDFSGCVLMCLALAELQSLQASVYGRCATQTCTAIAAHELNKRENVMDKQSKASELNAGIRSTI